MKKLLTCVIFCYNFHVTTSQLNSQQTPAPIIINVHTTSQSDVKQSNDLHQNAHQTSNQSTHVTHQEPSYRQQLHDMYNEHKKTCYSSTQACSIWISENKMKTACIGLIICYSSIMYQIYSRNQILKDLNAWSFWQHNKSLEDLFAIPHQTLESELLFMIQNRYVHPANPTDFIYSLIQASISLNHEIATVQQQILLYQWIEKCHSSQLFFIKEIDLVGLKEKQRKLAFIKHLFSSWCARYKIDQNS